MRRRSAAGVADPASRDSAIEPATDSIPIVAFDLETDPVQRGYATSLARPRGNITGVFLDMPQLIGKWLELLTAVVPQLSRVALFWDPATDPLQRDAAQAAARVLALEVHLLEMP
jgi:ABC-type uncharacterized transport system substrate-binding protein